MSSAPIIECRSIGKVFRTHRRAKDAGFLRSLLRREVAEFVALRDVSLSIPTGQMVGLIGANGAGKTTLVKCLSGIIPASSGTATLFGRDCFYLRDQEKRRLSLVMGQRSQLWWDIPAMDSFRLLKEIYAVDAVTFERRVREHAERLGVADRLDVQLRHLSLGQRMKMEIIGAFVHEPDVVFLDEPTIGLDLVSQETIREFLRDINRRLGVTIVLTSHDRADREQTCERLILLDAGALLFDGRLLDLQRRLVQRRFIEIHLEPGSQGWRPEFAAEVASFGASLVREAPLMLSFDVPADRSQAFIQRLFDLFQVHDLNVERQPLEELVKQIFRKGEMTPTSETSASEASLP